MEKTEKLKLCEKNRILLMILYSWGHGQALQKQLRSLCVRLRLYASEQMFDRVVRKLKDNQIIKRQTFEDGRSDVLLLCKFALAFLMDQPNTQRVGALKRHTTSAAMMQSVFRFALLEKMIDSMQRAGKSLNFETVFLELERCHATYMLRLPGLLPYFSMRMLVFGEEQPSEYRYQKKLMMQFQQHRYNLAHPKDAKPLELIPGIEPLSLEHLHRAGIMIQTVRLTEIVYCIFSQRCTEQAKMVNKLIMAYRWTQRILPSHTTRVIIYTKSEQVKKRWISCFRANGYLFERMRMAQIPFNHIHVSVRNLGITESYCNGMTRFDRK